MAEKGVWITWEVQRRNHGMSRAFDWPLHEIIHKGGRVRRYFKSIAETFFIIRKQNPQFVAAQNPSIVLALFVVLWGKFSSFATIIDAHNAGLFPCEGENAVMMALARFLQKHADYTIVTNENLAVIVRKNGGRPLVLPDRVPEVTPSPTFPVETGKVNMAFVCSFSPDEPFADVIAAAKAFPEQLCLYVTGKYQGKVSLQSIPENVKLLGFVSDEDYWKLLSTVDGLIVLTTRNDCLVCGAYEGVALGKPMILSNTTALKEYFSSGCLYTTPDSADIARAFDEFIHNKDLLIADMAQLQSELPKRWQTYFDKAANSLGIA